MNIQQLEYLIAVDRYKHFAKAAKESNITQPTLSVMIQKIENELGVKIFDRSKSPVATTKVGKEIIELAKTVIETTKEIADIAKREKGLLWETFLLGVIPTIATYMVPKMLENSFLQLPNFELVIKENTTTKVIDSIIEGSLDGGIVAGPISHQKLMSIPIYYEKFYAYVSPLDQLHSRSKIDIGKIDINKIWLLDNEHCLRGQIENLCNSKKNSGAGGNIKFESGSIDTLLNVVDFNEGITIIPEMHAMALPEDKQDNLRQLKNTAVREVCFVCKNNRKETDKRGVIIDSIKKSVPSSMLNSDLRKYVVDIDV